MSVANVTRVHENKKPKKTSVAILGITAPKKQTNSQKRKHAKKRRALPERSGSGGFRQPFPLLFFRGCCEGIPIEMAPLSRSFMLCFGGVISIRITPRVHLFPTRIIVLNNNSTPFVSTFIK